MHPCHARCQSQHTMHLPPYIYNLCTAPYECIYYLHSYHAYFAMRIHTNLPSPCYQYTLVCHYTLTIHCQYTLTILSISHSGFWNLILAHYCRYKLLHLPRSYLCDSCYRRVLAASPVVSFCAFLTPLLIGYQRHLLTPVYLVVSLCVIFLTVSVALWRLFISPPVTPSNRLSF